MAAYDALAEPDQPHTQLGVPNVCREAVDCYEFGPCKCDPLGIIMSARMSVLFRGQNNKWKINFLIGLLNVRGGRYTISQAKLRQIKIFLNMP